MIIWMLLKLMFDRYYDIVICSPSKFIERGLICSICMHAYTFYLSISWKKSVVGR